MRTSSPPWDWMRDEMTRGHRQASPKALRAASRGVIAGIYAGPRELIVGLWALFEFYTVREAKLLVSA